MILAQREKKKREGKKQKKKKKMSLSIPFSTRDQPAPKELLEQLVPSGTVFRNLGRDLWAGRDWFVVQKTLSRGRYHTKDKRDKIMMLLVNKICVDKGVAVIRRATSYTHAFYAGFSTQDELVLYKRAKAEETLAHARLRLVGRYFAFDAGSESRRVDAVRLSRFDNEEVEAYGHYNLHPLVLSRLTTITEDAMFYYKHSKIADVIYVFPRTVPQLSTSMSMKEQSAITGENGGVHTWIRDYTRENAIAICLLRLLGPGLVHITHLILQFYWE
jgi:hypothetical protein